jgi:membrane-associated phospholipid phosphatase
MTLFEPQRWQSLIHTLNTITFNSPVLVKLIPILADVFVFTYPVLLLIWYITGIVKQKQSIKSDALTVFSWAAYAAIINIILQSFLHKDRPIFSWDNSIHLILQDLPTASFPSDHAAVSMVIWLVVALIAYQHKSKLIKSLALALIFSSVLMSVSRVAVWVHWPTDIIAGWGVAIIVASLLSLDSIQWLQQQYINKPIIRLQERLFDTTWITKILPK